MLYIYIKINLTLQEYTYIIIIKGCFIYICIYINKIKNICKPQLLYTLRGVRLP